MADSNTFEVNFYGEDNAARITHSRQLAYRIIFLKNLIIWATLYQENFSKSITKEDCIQGEVRYNKKRHNNRKSQQRKKEDKL
jgi:hypothetical protein